MTSFAARWRDKHNAEVLSHVGGETLVNGSHEHTGAFYNGQRDLELRDGTILVMDISFDCQLTDDIEALEEGATVTVEGDDYRFIRYMRIDESDLVAIELGKVSA